MKLVNLHTFIMSPHIYLSLNFVHKGTFVYDSMHICLHINLLLCIPIYYDWQWQYSCSHKLTWRLTLRYCLRKHSDRTHSTSHCRSGLSLGYLWCHHICICIRHLSNASAFSIYIHLHIYVYMSISERHSYIRVSQFDIHVNLQKSTVAQGAVSLVNGLV